MSNDTMLVKDAQAAVESVLRKLQAAEARIAALETELHKARDTAPAPTVADAIAKVRDDSLRARRSTAVTKQTGAELSDHFLSDKIAKRTADEAAEAERIATEGIRATAEALRKKAAGR